MKGRLFQGLASATKLANLSGSILDHLKSIYSSTHPSTSTPNSSLHFAIFTILSIPKFSSVMAHRNCRYSLPPGTLCTAECHVFVVVGQVVLDLFFDSFAGLGVQCFLSLSKTQKPINPVPPYASAKSISSRAVAGEENSQAVIHEESHHPGCLFILFHGHGHVQQL